MLKQKYLIIAGVGLGLVLLAGGGIWIKGSHGKTGLTQDLSAAQSDVSQTLQLPAAQTIPLTPSQTESSNSGGLSVSSGSSANRMGQLGGKQDTGSSSGSGSASSGGSSAARALDPTTFAQYDKYKDGNSGLFGDIQVGDGTELTANHKAAVYYRGWLTNGQLFDESRAGSDGKLQPFVFTLGEHKVIPGWEEAIAGMKVGGVRLIIVPPAAGYGAAGQGSIPPNAVLVFQVQLAAVQ